MLIAAAPTYKSQPRQMSPLMAVTPASNQTRRDQYARPNQQLELTYQIFYLPLTQRWHIARDGQPQDGDTGGSTLRRPICHASSIAL